MTTRSLRGFRLAAAVIILSLFPGCATRREASRAPGPPPAEDELYAGVGLALSLGDPAKAVDALEEAEKRNPDSVETKKLLAQVLLMAGRPEDARTILESILAENPRDPDVLYSLALAAGAGSDRAEQKKLLARTIEAAPEDDRAHAALGEIFLQEKKLDAAEESFDRSLAENPSNLTALLGKGALELRRGKPAEAEKALTRAIETDPGYPFAYADRARARAETGAFEEAVRDMDTAVSMDPENPWNYYDRGKIKVGAGKPLEALADFSKAVELEPGLFMAYVYRARIHDGRDDREKALADYRTALRLRPDYPYIRLPLAILEYKNENWEAAADFFRRAGDLERDEPAYHLLVSLCYKNAGDERRAAAYLESVLGSFPRNTLIYHTARYYLQPSSDIFILQQITNEKNRVLKARMLFYIAAQYKLQGRSASAAAYFLEAAENKTRGLIENTLAGWELEKPAKR